MNFKLFFKNSQNLDSRYMHYSTAKMNSSTADLNLRIWTLNSKKMKLKELYFSVKSF